MILLKNKEDLDHLRAANLIVAETLQELKTKIAPGMTTAELDKIAEDFIKQKGARPAFKGYRGYPATLCIAVNEEVVHGIPGSRKWSRPPTGVDTMASTTSPPYWPAV